MPTKHNAGSWTRSSRWPSGRSRSGGAISGCSCTLAASGAGLRYNLHLAAKRGEELTALESRAQANSFRLMSAARELAGKEVRLAAEVDLLLEMVKGQKENDRETRLYGDGRLQDAHAEADRLRKEKLKGKKKKKKKRNLARLHRDDLRAEQHRAAAVELMARLEAELVETAREEDEDYEKTD